MGCNFSAVWGQNHSGCSNIRFDLTGRFKPTGGILQKFDLSVATCAEAMTILGDRLATRLSASDMVVMSAANSQFDLGMRIGRVDATAQVKPANNCNFPIHVRYSKADDSGEADFGDLDQVLRWLTIRLRR
jgi:hypothetical protein